MKGKRVLKESDEKIVQIRNRNIKRKKKRRIVFSAILLLIGVMLALLLLPCFNITEINVEGNNKVTQASVIEQSRIVKGDNIFKINIKKTKNQIMQIPYVDTVKVIRKLPSIVVIEITERKGVAAVPTGEGFAVIDNTCKILETTEETKLPVIEGIKPAIKVGSNLEESLPDFTARFKELVAVLEGKNIKERITGYKVDDSGEIDLVIDGTKRIVIGDYNNIEYKMVLLESVINELPPTQSGTIDLTNEGQALYSPDEPGTDTTVKENTLQ